MLDALDRLRNQALRMDGVLDFDMTAAWIAEEWSAFVDDMGKRLPAHQEHQQQRGGHNNNGRYLGQRPNDHRAGGR